MPVNPPRPPVPLTALRAFEAAARLGGFAAAAAELGVTPGAVAAQIKTLEDRLGVPLFDRDARGVQLATFAQPLSASLSLAFDQLHQAWQALDLAARPGTVRIATLPSLAQLWLSPRLPDLRAAAPDITISITALETPPEGKRDPHDLCLFYRPQGHRGALEQDEIFPVCAPALAARMAAAADLGRVPCLSDSTWSGDWRIWCDLAGTGVVPRGPVFSLYALAVEEAINGAGVLIGHRALVARHLARGRLVVPFGPRLGLPQVLALWAPRPLAPASAAARVLRWLQDHPA
jgi:DNA-binding transcriptional LysR family regulator